MGCTQFVAAESVAGFPQTAERDFAVEEEAGDGKHSECIQLL